MKNKKNSSILKTIIIVFIAVVLILFIILGILFVKKSSKPQNNSVNNGVSNQVKGITDFKSIEEILQFSEATFISEESYEDNEYTIKIKAKFKYNLYENNESKENYYLAIINRISYFYRYQKNYILEDSEKNIEIKVSNNGTKIKNIIINGLENFYRVKNNQAKENVNMLESVRIDSKELDNIIENKFKYKESIFGNLDSTFNEFNVFWDEGIDVKVNNSDVVTNIVFNTKYDGKIINNLNAESSKEQIKKILGSPILCDKEFLLGYSCEKFYIFFNTLEKEVSVYPKNNKKNYEECINLINDFLNSKIDIKDFMNELTYEWPEYYDYEYSSNYLKICYPNEGLKIEYGDKFSEGIVIYDSFVDVDGLKHWIDNGTILYKKNETLYTELEEKRIEENFILNSSANLMYEFSDIEPIISDIYSFTYKENSDGQINTICFISKNPEYPNKELKEYANSGLIVSNEIFVYSIRSQGIYAYNMVTNEKITIVEGTEDYNLVKFEDNVLYYDESSIVLEVS